MGATPSMLFRTNDSHAIEAVHPNKVHCEKNFQFQSMQLAFLLDCTGSMSSEISSMKTSVTEIASAYEARATEFSMAFLCFRDVNDGTDRFQWAVEGGNHWFTDIEKLEEQIATMKAKGGGPGPEEDSAGALGEALQKLNFDSSSKNNFMNFRSMLLIYQKK